MCSLFRNRNRHNSLRYSGRDYSQPGKYFITICTARMDEWFGNVINGKMYLSEIGHIAAKMWNEIPVHFSFIDLDEFIVMPNHIHGIIIIKKPAKTGVGGALHATPLLSPDATSVTSPDKTFIKNEIMAAISPKPGSLSVVVRSYKSAVSKYAHVINSYFSWQSSFYDNIICTKGQLNRIRKYILNNPQNWNKTEHNCNNIK